MGVLRGIGYFFAILLIIGGVLLFPLGLVLIVPGAIMIYVLRKGGQLSNMQKTLKSIERIEKENQDLRLKQARNDALANRPKDPDQEVN